MWLATKHGFYSIVKKDRDQFHVRARVAQDLVNLREQAGIKAYVKRWPEADYRYRLIVSRRQLEKIFRCAIEPSIDYPNFKSQIAATPDQRGKLIAYHHVWTEMMQLQR